MNTPLPMQRVRPSRRQFFRVAGVLSAGTLTSKVTGTRSHDSTLPSAFSGLKPLGERVRPITPDAFRQRIERAQQLMAGAPLAPSGSPSQAAKYDALFFAPGTSLYYFTGIRWGLSERLVGL